MEDIVNQIREQEGEVVRLTASFSAKILKVFLLLGR